MNHTSWFETRQPKFTNVISSEISFKYASLASWKNDWLLDSGETCHMTFRRYFFEEFIDIVDGVVYFANKSKLNPLGLATIRLKFPSHPDFLLYHVLHLPQLRRNLLPLVHIR